MQMFSRDLVRKGAQAARRGRQVSYQGTPSGVPKVTQNQPAFRRWVLQAGLYHGLLALSLLALPATLLCATEQPKPTDVPAIVIAHLVLPQPTGSQMLLQREEGKQYLYVQQASKQGFMIVDVSKPEQPSLLKRTADQNQSTSGNLEMVSPNVAIAEAPEKTPTTLTNSSHPTETVRLLDLSDPANPKTLETFTKVTSLLPDGAHGLIYLTNDQGLWVLRYNRPGRFEPEKKKKPCDSESEIAAMPPDCD